MRKAQSSGVLQTRQLCSERTDIDEVQHIHNVSSEASAIEY